MKVFVLSRMDSSTFRDFTIDSEGAYLHWPRPDIHLDLAALRAAIDPREAERQRQLTLRYSKKFGAAVRRVRRNHRLSQMQVRGVTERELRRIESGEHSPRIATFEVLAAAHGLYLKGYLDELAIALQEATAAEARVRPEIAAA